MSMKSLSELELYTSHKFGPGYPVEEYVKLSDSAGDAPLGALKYLLKTCKISFVVASYGINAALSEDLLRLMRAPNIYVQLTLDSGWVPGDTASRSGMLALAEEPSNSVAFTDLSTAAYGVVDGLDTFDLTDSSIIVTRQPFVAVRERNKLDLLHGTAVVHRG
jgi:hypothetical protein